MAMARWEFERQEAKRRQRLAAVRGIVQTNRPPRPQGPQPSSRGPSREPSVQGSRQSSQCSTPLHLWKPRARSASPGKRLQPLEHQTGSPGPSLRPECPGYATPTRPSADHVQSAQSLLSPGRRQERVQQQLPRCASDSAALGVDEDCCDLLVKVNDNLGYEGMVKLHSQPTPARHASRSEPPRKKSKQRPPGVPTPRQAASGYPVQSSSVLPPLAPQQGSKEQEQPVASGQQPDASCQQPEAPETKPKSGLGNAAAIQEWLLQANKKVEALRQPVGAACVTDTAEPLGANGPDAGLPDQNGEQKTSAEIATQSQCAARVSLSADVDARSSRTPSEAGTVSPREAAEAENERVEERNILAASLTAELSAANTDSEIVKPASALPSAGAHTGAGTLEPEDDHQNLDVSSKQQRQEENGVPLASVAYEDVAATSGVPQCDEDADTSASRSDAGTIPPDEAAEAEEERADQRKILTASLTKELISANADVQPAIEQCKSESPKAQPDAVSVLAEVAEEVEGEGHYLVDNREFTGAGPGVTYRRSKNLDDKIIGDIAKWGTLIYGSVAAGWLTVFDLKLGEKFLPLRVTGAIVLFKQKSDAEQHLPDNLVMQEHTAANSEEVQDVQDSANLETRSDTDTIPPDEAAEAEDERMEERNILTASLTKELISANINIRPETEQRVSDSPKAQLDAASDLAEVAEEVEGEGRYLVDKREFTGPGPGVTYRRSMDLNDKILGDIAKWGTLIFGSVAGGWLKVFDLKLGEKFLPLKVNGATVLFKQQPDAEQQCQNVPVVDQHVPSNPDVMPGVSDTGPSRDQFNAVGNPPGEAAAAEETRVREQVVPAPLEKLELISGQADDPPENDKHKAGTPKAQLHAVAASAEDAAEADGEGRYLVDNCEFKGPGPGVTYRRSKDLNDKILGDIAKWGAVIFGSVADGWLTVFDLKVGEKFLPLKANGARVLFKQEARQDVNIAQPIASIVEANPALADNQPAGYVAAPPLGRSPDGRGPHLRRPRGTTQTEQSMPSGSEASENTEAMRPPERADQSAELQNGADASTSRSLRNRLGGTCASYADDFEDAGSEQEDDEDESEASDN